MRVAVAQLLSPAVLLGGFFHWNAMQRGIGRLRAGGQSPLAALIASLYGGGAGGAVFDNSNMSTMFQDSAGTTPVTAAGQPVGKQLDISGRGNHRIQATAANRPILTADGSGNLHLLYNGTNSYMSVTWGASLAQPNTVAMSVTPITGGVNLYFYDAPITAQHAGYMKNTNAPAVFSGVELLGTAVTLGNPFVLVNTHNGASSEVDQNTTSGTPGASGANASTGLQTGMAQGGTNFLNFREYGTWFYNGVLTGGQKLALQKFLGSKAGLSL